MITKSAQIKSNYRKHAIFTNSAREGWRLILKQLNLNDKILLPSYIGITDKEGSGIFDPILQEGLEYEFYTLSGDLSIPLDLFEATLLNEKYKLVLLVHYFGFRIENLKAIVDLCKKHEVLVVEDCAHLYNYNLYNFSDAGTYGDFVFYSLHKNYPLKSGGLVVQNNQILPPINSSEVQLNSNLASNIAMYDLEAIVKKRIQNYKYLDRLLCDVKGIKRLKTLGNNDIPHNYPIYIQEGLREKLYFWMSYKDIHLIALYYRLIDGLNTKKYTEMLDLSNSILNLPVHQDMTNENIESLVKLLIEGLSEIKK